MGQVIKGSPTWFPDKHRERLIRELEELLEKARSGELKGLLFLSDSGSHEYGVVGSYLDSPIEAFFPGCKVMYELSILIGQSGGFSS